MTLLRYSYSSLITFSSPVTNHSFALRCVPRVGASQTLLQHNVTIKPYAAVSYTADNFGNGLITGLIEAAHTTFSFQSTGLVNTHATDRHQPPASVFSYPTPLTTPTPELRRAAQALSCGSSVELAERINDLLRRHMKYCPGETTVSTTAAQAFAEGVGVCQDYAHIAITLARILGFKARYVAGLIPGHGETHAWLEIANDGRWVAFDPTNDTLDTSAYITLATGRDFNDTSLSRGAFTGSAQQTQTVSVDVDIVRDAV